MKKAMPLGGWLLLTGLSVHAENVVLKLGETRRLPLGANEHVWVQNKKTLLIANSGKSLQITGRSEGSTVIDIGDHVYQIQVLHPLQKNLGKDFEKQLHQSLGLRLSYEKNQVVVGGKLFLWQDWLRLAEAAQRNETTYVMAAEIPEHLQEQADRYWQEEMERLGLPRVPVHFGHGLEARIATGSEMYEKYAKIFEPFGVTLEKDKEAVNIAPVVRVQITVAEVKHEFITQYGLEWPSSYNATLVQGTNEPVVDDLVFSAHALEQQGQGKILASPTILCRSGKEAEFLAGGEFPIKIINFKMQDVVWKKYGVILKVKPQADTSGRMSIALQTEVSTLDTAHAVDGIPGVLSNSISSHFDLTRPQTIALSGLIKNEESQGSVGLPLLSRLPILGALFSSKDFRENRTELVIFVKPSIMKEGQTVANTKMPTEHLGGWSHD